MRNENDDKQRIFETAAAIDSEQERSAYLKAACGGDLELFREIEDRLRKGTEAGATAETPTVFVPRRDDVRWTLAGDSVEGYRILDMLGEGGMGVVYRAEQTLPMRRLVALKLIKLGMDTREVVRRFESEQNALALMGHPNIAQVFDAGATKDGRPYFAMELVEGTPIDEYCDRHHLGIGKRLELFRQVCHGVHHAHLRGVVHRDIKPSNVLVTVTDDLPVVKIIDFGIAKAMNQRLTEQTLYTLQGQVVGTPAYMSPEQAGSSTDAVDHRTDVYSLGVLLYELLVGELPLDWESASKSPHDELVRRIRVEEPPPPSTRWSRLSVERSGELAGRRGSNPAVIARLIRGELDWITTRAIEKEPARRYATVSELEADIARYLSYEPVLARPPGTVYRIRKFAKRHRALVAGALAVTLALLVGLVAALNATLRMHEAHRQAQEVVCDLYTDSGIERAEDGEAALATLWFAGALDVPHGDPSRLRATEARFSYWLGEAAMPVHALEHGRGVVRICYHPASTHLLTFDSESRFTVWDLESGEALDLVPAGVEVADAAWSPRGDWLAVASSDGDIEIRTFPSGAIVHRIDASPLSIGAIAFSPDGRLLALGGDGARVWSCESGRFVSERLDPSGTVRWLGFNARGDRLLTSADDRKARVYALKGGGFGPDPLFEPVPHLVEYNIAGLTRSSLQWKPTFVDGDRGVLTVETPTRVVWWDSETGAKIRTLPVRDRLLGVRPSPDGRLVAVVDQTRTRFWDIARERFDEERIDREVVVSAAVWSPDSASILLAGVDGSVEEWSAVSRIPMRLSGNPWHRVASTPLAAATTILEYAPDALQFATSESGTARVFRRAGAIHTGARYLPPPLMNRAIALTSDGRYAVQDRRGGFKPMRFVRVYDLEKGIPASPRLRLAGELYASSFTPAGDLLQTTSSLESADGAPGTSRAFLVELWDWSRGKRLHTAELPSPPWVSKWSLDESRLAIRCRNGEILTISGDSGEIVARVATDADEDAVFAPGGNELVCWRPGEPVRIRDSRTGEERTPGLEVEVRCTAVHFSDDGARLVTVSPEGATRVWDYRSGRVRSPEMVHGVEIHELDIEGELIATHGADEIVRVWRWTDAEVVGTPFRLPASGSCLRFVRAEPRWLFTFTWTSGIQVWDWHAGQRLLSLPLASMTGHLRDYIVSDAALAGSSQVDMSAIRSRLDRAYAYPAAMDLAELLSGHALHHGNVVALSDEERRERRRRVNHTKPRVLSFDELVVDRLAWHRRLAEAFEGSWHYDSAIWHSCRLGDAARPEELATRARIRSWVRGWRFAPVARPWRGADLGVLDEIASGELEAIIASTRTSRLERSTGPYIDFRLRYSDQNSLSLGHVLRVIRCEEARRCRIFAGSDDTLRLWVNGVEVFADPRLGPAFADYHEVPLQLAEGDNVLLVEVGQSGGDWGLFLRIEDEDGRPLLVTDDGDLLPARDADPPPKE